MEHYIPELAIGFLSSGGSIWLRNKFARKAVEQTYQTHDKDSFELKKDLQHDAIDYKNAIRSIEDRLDKATHKDEMDSLMLEARTADEYHRNQLARHKKRSEYQGTYITKLDRGLRLIKFKAPLFLGIAALGLAGYEFFTGNNDLGIGSLAFAIPHLFEAAANQKTGLK
ncbi:MAG: hypothetical protein ACOYUB_01810 [Patescibacteria group bacterium]